MKLYTEIQMLEAIDRAIFTTDINSFDILEDLTPIELPSDEEISKVAMVVYGFDARDIKDVLEYKAFKRGAKWMRDKIQGGNE